MKHQRDIQCPASRGTVYPFDVSKLTETSVASVYLYLICSATGAFDLSMQSAIMYSVVLRHQDRMYFL